MLYFWIMNSPTWISVYRYQTALEFWNHSSELVLGPHCSRKWLTPMCLQTGTFPDQGMTIVRTPGGSLSWIGVSGHLFFYFVVLLSSLSFGMFEFPEWFWSLINKFTTNLWSTAFLDHSLPSSVDSRILPNLASWALLKVWAVFSKCSYEICGCTRPFVKLIA